MTAEEQRLVEAAKVVIDVGKGLESAGTVFLILLSPIILPIFIVCLPFLFAKSLLSGEFKRSFTEKFIRLQFGKHGVRVELDGDALVLHSAGRTPFRLSHKWCPEQHGSTEAFLRKCDADVRQWLEATP